MPSAEETGTGGPRSAAGSSAESLPVFRPIDEETIHQGRFIRLQRARFADPAGAVFERDIVRHPGAVAVVPVTDDDAVVLVRQYRPAVDRWLLEIPAGTCDVAGEPVETTAARELAEEAGYESDRLTFLGDAAMTPGFCDEIAHLFLATGLRPVPTDRQGTEERYMEAVEIPLDRFDAMVDDGSVIDASTILGVTLARRRLGV